MTKLWTISLLLLLSLRAFAVDDVHVRYAGGTVAGFSAGTFGRLDMTGDSALTFQYAGRKASIPYDTIESHEYSKQVARHLGILPAIAIALFKTRQYRHIFRISYRDPDGTRQVVVLEVPKQMQRTLQAVLDTRAPQTSRLPPCGCLPSGS